MAEPLVFAPDYLLPVDTQGALGYREGHEPEAEVLERVGFFVPAYIEHPNAHWMARMPRLDVVQLPTVGFDAVVPHLPTGVTLCNAAGVHEQSTAELAVGSIITVWRGLDRAARDMVEGTWGHRRGRSLQQARVVIIGAGGVGTAIARALEPFGCSQRLPRIGSGHRGHPSACRAPRIRARCHRAGAVARDPPAVVDSGCLHHSTHRW
ncbi:MAG: hypothetical protein EBY42_00045 [Actinobacteria bacterium]|nr:hypothetical protein [Actinomycetota bacterium]